MFPLSSPISPPPLCLSSPQPLPPSTNIHSLHVSSLHHRWVCLLCHLLHLLPPPLPQPHLLHILHVLPLHPALKGLPASLLVVLQHAGRRLASLTLLSCHACSSPLTSSERQRRTSPSSSAAPPSSPSAWISLASASRESPCSSASAKH